MKPLLSSLKDLGAGFSTLIEGQDIPFTIQGPLTGGETTVSGITSQFLSSLLLAAPLINNDTTIYVVDLHEKPYVEITLWWLDKMGVRYSVSDDFSTFTVEGGQQYHPINERITGDFSSATFGAVAAAITGGPVTLDNLDFTDPQGDKGIFALLKTMGVSVVQERNGAVVEAGSTVRGATIDLNTMPDALPAFSVLGCVAEGETRIANVKQARIKETDRIQVMAAELSKMEADIEEREDGLVIRKSKLTGCSVKGHDDHRVVMALALAGMVSEGETIIDTAESAAVTYPGFVNSFVSIGANIEEVDA
jgi:3-phosphoshikimate 1-carboxyvinyltransferase